MTKRIPFALAAAALVLAAATSLRYAQALDFLGPEGARRAIQVVVGLVLAVYGNYLPKELGRARASACAVRQVQSALRTGGWAFTLAGVAHAGLWAFAPLAVARPAAMIAVASATVVTLLYGSWAALSCRVAPEAR